MKARIIILCFLLSVQTRAQQDSSQLRDRISVETGYHASYIGNSYLDLSNIKSSEEMAYLVGYRIQSAGGFQISIIYDKIIRNNLSLSTGIVFFNRRTVLEIDSVSLNQLYPTFGDYGVLKYNYSPIKIELPFIVGYRVKNIDVQAGVLLTAFQIYGGSRLYVTGKEQAIRDAPYYVSTKLHPGIKVYYTICRRGEMPFIKLYAGVDVEDFSRNYYRFQAGMNVAIYGSFVNNN